MVLGGGSNLLVADAGVDALVVRLRTTGVDATVEADEVRARVAAGERWDGFVARCVAEGWAGLECLSGIPGDVGGTPIQNVGAYGQEVAQRIESVEVVAIDGSERRRFSNVSCGFRYRDSIFKREARGAWVVASVTFRLSRGGVPAVRYPELSRHLARQLGDAAPSLGQVRTAVLALRRAKSMVLDPTDENRRSAGSFFTNPIVPAAVAESVRDRARERGVLAADETMPAWPGTEGVKLSAGWLIERSGFAKGDGRGPVGLSTRHALAVVNRGGATAAEIVAFAGLVRSRVLERFGVALTPEPVPLGLSSDELATLGLGS